MVYEIPCDMTLPYISNPHLLPLPHIPGTSYTMDTFFFFFSKSLYPCMHYCFGVHYSSLFFFFKCFFGRETPTQLKIFYFLHLCHEFIGNGLHRAARPPFHWLSQSVLLLVEQNGASVE